MYNFQFFLFIFLFLYKIVKKLNYYFIIVCVNVTTNFKLKFYNKLIICNVKNNN